MKLSIIPKNVNLAILITWLIAATLDALSAVLMNIHLNPGRIFIYISSAVFGKAAFYAGNKMIIYGLIFHYLIAFIFTTTWFTVYPTFKRLFKLPYAIAILYGMLTWLIMNLVVVPLSHAPKAPMNAKGAMIGMAILIICIGFPITLMANSYYKKYPIAKKQ